MISSDVIRGYSDTMILYILSEHDSYGYEISKQIKERSEGVYTIKETTLYSAFARLEKNQYIASYPGTQTHGKRRTYYRLTDKGYQYYKDKCREWEVTRTMIDQFIKKEGA